MRKCVNKYLQIIVPVTYSRSIIVSKVMRKCVSTSGLLDICLKNRLAWVVTNGALLIPLVNAFARIFLPGYRADILIRAVFQ